MKISGEIRLRRLVMTKKTKAVLHDHAKRRFIERYNLSIDNQTLKEIEQNIRLNKSIRLYKASNRIKIHAVRLPRTNEVIAVAYDTTRNSVVSVYPKDYLIQYIDIIKENVNILL
jgi:hypothetical protein